MATNVAAARGFLGGLNACINCAGILGAGRVLGRDGAMALEHFSKTVMVNLVGSFNVAKAAAAVPLTRTGMVVGTAQYVSPEQAQGLDVDGRSDLYSVGCLLYELLTGRPPFVGDSPVSVAYQHVREDPQPPSAYNPAVTPALDAVILTGLAKDREQRYPSAVAFSRDIAAVVAGRAPDGRVVALVSDVRRRGADVAKPQLVFAPAEGPGQGGTA